MRGFHVVEFVEAKTIPACREVLKKITRDDIYELFRRFMEVEKYSVKKDRLEIVYVCSPDEFTRKRIKLKLEYKEEENEIIVRGKGSINVELIVRCSRDDEVLAGLTIYGKAEKYVGRKQVENFMKKLLELVESKAPVAVQAAIPTEAPSTIPVSVAPVEGTPITSEKQRLDCVTRLFTAGLVVDEDISRDIPNNYHLTAGTAGRLIEDGTASVDVLDFSMYVTNHDVRIVHGDIFVESVRLGGEKVGVYYCNHATNEEAFGETAVEKARDRICRKGVEVSYLVIELPQ